MAIVARGYCELAESVPTRVICAVATRSERLRPPERCHLAEEARHSRRSDVDPVA